jgi:hypothetical protein
VIREFLYPVWLANIVLVKKKNRKWRMCVYFKDLNKTCEKDDFPLDRVDKIVDDAANSEMLSLLDMSEKMKRKHASSLLLEHFVS